MKPIKPGLIAKLTKLATDESGQDLIEYALVAALIGLGAIVSIKGLRTSIASALTSNT